MLHGLVRKNGRAEVQIHGTEVKIRVKGIKRDAGRLRFVGRSSDEATATIHLRGRYRDLTSVTHHLRMNPRLRYR